MLELPSLIPIPTAMRDKKIIARMLVDKEFRKQAYKEAFIQEYVNPTEFCIAQESELRSDKDYKTYRERTYNTDRVWLDGHGGFVIKEIREPDGHDYEDEDKAYEAYVKKVESMALYAIELTETIYYDKTIEDIYKLKHLELMESYARNPEGEPLSFLELIFPTQMPTQDHFPFADFDYKEKIPLPLTELEKKMLRKYEKKKERSEKRARGEEWEEEEEEETHIESNYFYTELIIDEEFWGCCIIWIDSHRMLMPLGCRLFYFKQVGKNTHLFELRDVECV